MDDVSVDILQRIQAGDGTAWDDFYLRFRDPLLCSIRLRLGRALRSKVDSEDVLHSVVREALDDLGAIADRGPGSLTRYLHVCVLNKIRKKAEHFGAGKRAGGIALTDSLIERLPRDAPGELRYLDAERYERLERAITALPERSREVILLRLVEGHGNTEAAAALGMQPDATSKLYTRALARLASLTGDAS